MASCPRVSHLPSPLLSVGEHNGLINFHNSVKSFPSTFLSRLLLHLLLLQVIFWFVSWEPPQSQRFVWKQEEGEVSKERNLKLKGAKNTRNKRNIYEETLWERESFIEIKKTPENKKKQSNLGFFPSIHPSKREKKCLLPIYHIAKDWNESSVSCMMHWYLRM